MEIEFIPLIQTQKELYELPRTPARFKAYLDTMRDKTTGDLNLPLSAMNPMGKEHLLPFIINLEMLDAEQVTADAITDALNTLNHIKNQFRLSLVIVDDYMGGWTNRYTVELKYRTNPYLVREKMWPYPWITPFMWTSEQYSAARIYAEVQTNIYRAIWHYQHGKPKILADYLYQEEYALKNGGEHLPAYSVEELIYTKQVLDDCLEEEGEPLLIPALFGDTAAHDLGYNPLGLSPRAGLALAQSEHWGNY